MWYKVPILYSVDIVIDDSNRMQDSIPYYYR